MDLFKYRKIIIYALTFLTYAWSGYGIGLLTNLRDAVLAAETVFQDFFANAITIARKIKDIHEVFDAAVEENCVFQCPDGAYFSRFIYQHRMIRLSPRTSPLISCNRLIYIVHVCVKYISWHGALGLSDLNGALFEFFRIRTEARSKSRAAQQRMRFSWYRG